MRIEKVDGKYEKRPYHLRVNGGCLCIMRELKLQRHAEYTEYIKMFSVSTRY